MNYRYSIFGVLFFLMTTAAVAQGSVYLNLRVDGDGNGSISQSAEKCTNCAGSLEVSDGDVSKGLNNLLKNWNPSGSVKLSLESNLNLRELSADGSCARNHTPLVLPAGVREFNGNNRVVSNMCYSHDVSSASVMTSPVGFFGSLESVKVSDVKFRNVLVSAKSSADENASNFRAVGTLAGIAKNSQISGVSFSNVKVTGPMAGGILGYAENTSIENIFALDKVVVANESKLTSGNVLGVNYGSGYYTLLGGAVGLAVNVHFSDIEMNVEILNSKNTVNSALGGLAGMYMVSGDLNKTGKENMEIQNVRIGKSYERSSVSGGSFMGGFFGITKKAGNGNSTGILVSNSIFKGDISNPIVNADLFMGGFVGNHTISDSALKISKSFSDVNLRSSIVSGIKHYIGGLIGGMIDIVSSSSKDSGEMVSITNSKVAGSIEVFEIQGGSISDGQIFVGGLAGMAGFAINDSAILADTVMVGINVSLNNGSVVESIYAGGFVGKAGIHENMQARMLVANSEYWGSVKVDGDAKSTYVSGGIGSFYKGYNGNHIDFENVRVIGDSSNSSMGLLSLKGEGGFGEKAYVGGLCGSCVTPRNVNNIEVKGEFELGRGIEIGDSLVVGTVLGDVTTGAKESDGIEFKLTNTYHVGSFKFTEENASLAQVKKGYLIGHIRMRVNGVPYTVKSNYHYGSDESTLADAIGFFDTGYERDNWAEYGKTCSASVACWDIQYNFRNGRKTDATNSMNGTYPIVYMNAEDVLKNDLNGAWLVESPWTREKGVNEGLPYLVAMGVAQRPSIKDDEKIDTGWDDLGDDPVIVVPPADNPSTDKPSVSDTSASDTLMAPEVKSVEWRMTSIKGAERSGADPIYWWDESVAVADIWQYRNYSRGEGTDSVTGFWVYTEKNLLDEEEGPVPQNLKIHWDVDSVYSGWNMVANPYGWTIDLSELDVNPEYVWRRVIEKNDYDHTTTLGPYEGLWIWTDTKKSLDFTARIVSPEGAALPKLAKSMGLENSDGWALRAVLTDEYGKQDSWNVLGANSHEEEVLEPPQGMGDQVRLSIINGKRALAKSFKTESETMEWNMKFAASTMRNGILDIQGVDQVNRNGKHVYVTIDGKITEMKEGVPLKVALTKTAKTAVVTVTAEPLELMKNPLGKLHVVRSGNSLGVSFDVSANLAGKEMKVDLVSVSGKVASSLRAMTAAGSNAFEMIVPKRGVYMLRVSVGSQIATQRINVQ